MSVRALGIALKLTFSGTNQLFYPQTWAFALIVATCVSTQINYLNKVIVQFSAFLLLLALFLWRRLGDKALPCFGPPRRRLSPPRRLGGGDSPQLALTP